MLALSKVRKQPEIFCLTLQVVRVAQGVRAIDLLVAGQPIVHQGATHASQEPQFLKGLCATFGVLAQPRQAGADQAVQPVQVALDAGMPLSSACTTACVLRASPMVPTVGASAWVRLVVEAHRAGL